ncbi:MAG: hypothetical protein JNM84_04810 [Planctomycetes bacterium]|nr:hypothetical protein [Planctomycetota bacterium]
MKMLKVLAILTLVGSLASHAYSDDCGCAAQTARDVVLGCAVVSWPTDKIVDDGECEKLGCGAPEDCGWRSQGGGSLTISCTGAAGYTVCDSICPIGSSCTPVCNTVFAPSLSTTLPLEVPCGSELKRTLVFFDGAAQPIGAIDMILRCNPCLED